VSSPRAPSSRLGRLAHGTEMYPPTVSRWARLREWLRDRPVPEPVVYGCAYCADNGKRWYGHVTQIASSEERGTILLRCPRCDSLYEITPAGTGPERRLTVAEAESLFPSAEHQPDRPV
jgi:hypothetical protein